MALYDCSKQAFSSIPHLDKSHDKKIRYFTNVNVAPRCEFQHLELR